MYQKNDDTKKLQQVFNNDRADPNYGAMEQAKRIYTTEMNKEQLALKCRRNNNAVFHDNVSEER
ncbi:hypothetical protein M513_05800 [Trichuris suis]|uniref:Uncharacterized protein n=1 Tax=Trichuris suis TaxID=68888 RepID=A0A085M7X3_9BILA|nr:hypothetical protein M513_05800 [Trichuris suis]